MNPKDLRVGATLRLNDVVVTHRYDDHFVVRSGSGEFSKAMPADVDSVVDQPMEKGDLVKRLGHGGTCRFVQYLDDPTWCAIIEVNSEPPKVVKTDNVHLIDPNNPKGPPE